MKIMLSGGGTGGHIYPAIAIYEILKQKYEVEAAYLGLKGSMEEKIVSREKEIKFFTVRAQGMPRSLSLKWFRFFVQNPLGVYDAYKHLKSFMPDLAVATGGYASFPMLMAARLLGIKYVIHEQNAAMGLTNKLFANAASKVLLTYASAAKTDGKRVSLTGNPVRQSFFAKKNTAEGEQNKKYALTVLAVGGSSGARSLNNACVELERGWLYNHSGIKLIHITGERDYKRVKEALEADKKPLCENYELLPYCHEMKAAFDKADLIISRAGATTLSELAVCHKPAILTPFPFATDNHQEKNARVLEGLNAAKVLLDADLNAKSLGEMILSLKDDKILKEMGTAMGQSRPANVEERIYNEISQVLQR